jgi:hypothetical protein
MRPNRFFDLARPWSPEMPVTAVTTIKFTEAERARIDELGKHLGSSSRPMPMADVVRRAVDALYEAELPKMMKRPKEKRA